MQVEPSEGDGGGGLDSNEEDDSGDHEGDDGWKCHLVADASFFLAY